MNDLKSKAEFARMRGWHHSYVSKLLRAGVIVALADGRLDVAACDARIAEFRQRHDRRDVTTVTAAGSDKAPAPGSLQESRIRTERLRAELLQMDRDQRAGTLCLASEVRAAAFSSARRARDGMLAIADRLAPVLAAESDSVRVHSLLLGEIRMALHGLADSIEIEGEQKP